MTDPTAKLAIMTALREAAIKGARCPDNDALSDRVYAAGGKRWRDALNELVSTGEISIEMAGKNWRVVHIVADNIRTLAEPAGRTAWMIIDQTGKHRR